LTLREDGDDLWPASEVWLRPLSAGGSDGPTLTDHIFFSQFSSPGGCELGRDGIALHRRQVSYR